MRRQTHRACDPNPKRRVREPLKTTAQPKSRTGSVLGNNLGLLATFFRSSFSAAWPLRQDVSAGMGSPSIAEYSAGRTLASGDLKEETPAGQLLRAHRPVPVESRHGSRTRHPSAQQAI